MPDRTNELMRALALREGTASQLSKRFDMTVDALHDFVEEHKDKLEALRAEQPDDLDDAELSPEQLSSLWITNKYERLRRYQSVADQLLKYIKKGGADATNLREFRTYLNYAAQELGQLLNRGAGAAEEHNVSYTVTGVDMEKLQ